MLGCSYSELFALELIATVLLRMTAERLTSTFNFILFYLFRLPALSCSLFLPSPAFTSLAFHATTMQTTFEVQKAFELVIMATLAVRV